MKVFSAEKYRQWREMIGWLDYSSEWPNKCDGKTVEQCRMMGYSVDHTSWLIDVPDPSHPSSSQPTDATSIADVKEEGWRGRFFDTPIGTEVNIGDVPCVIRKSPSLHHACKGCVLRQADGAVCLKYGCLDSQRTDRTSVIFALRK